MNDCIELKITGEFLSSDGCELEMNCEDYYVFFILDLKYENFDPGEKPKMYSDLV